MKKLFLFSSILLLIFFSSGCKKDETVQCRIEGYVMDAESGTHLDSVKVEILSGDQSHSTQTNKNGYYNLGDVSIGDYVLVFSKTGYLKTSKELKLTADLDPGNYKYEVTKTDIIKLSPLKERLVLTIYRKYLTGQILAAANFPYSVSLGDFNDPINGQTDASGVINLNNLPRQVSLSMDYTLNGIKYKTNTLIDTRNNNSMIVYGYSPEASLGLASSNVLDALGQSVVNFDVNSNISVQFTIPVDTVHSSVKLLLDGWTTVSATKKWSNNNMKIELDPVNPLSSKRMYTVEIDITNETQKQSYSNALDFQTK